MKLSFLRDKNPRKLWVALDEDGQEAGGAYTLILKKRPLIIT